MFGRGRPRLTDATDSAFHPGEVWRYHARPEEPGSTLTVLRVDRDPKLGNIVHVRVDGLRIPDPHHPSGFSGEIMHLPFDERAVVGSVSELVRSGVAIPDHEAGYAEWRRAFDTGEAGVFTISVGEAVAVRDRAING
ncbi:MAG TPA: hypothetical protein VF541_09005 [Longimicrobium sp.]